MAADRSAVCSLWPRCIKGRSCGRDSCCDKWHLGVGHQLERRVVKAGGRRRAIRVDRLRVERLRVRRAAENGR